MEIFMDKTTNLENYSYKGGFVVIEGLLSCEPGNQFLKNHQLNKAEIGVTDESISDWISVLQDTYYLPFLKQ